jgi:hypothetical protein
VLVFVLLLSELRLACESLILLWCYYDALLTLSLLRSIAF